MLRAAAVCRRGVTPDEDHRQGRLRPASDGPARRRTRRPAGRGHPARGRAGHPAEVPARRARRPQARPPGAEHPRRGRRLRAVAPGHRHHGGGRIPRHRRPAGHRAGHGAVRPPVHRPGDGAARRVDGGPGEPAPGLRERHAGRPGARRAAVGHAGPRRPVQGRPRRVGPPGAGPGRVSGEHGECAALRALTRGDAGGARAALAVRTDRPLLNAALTTYLAGTGDGRVYDRPAAFTAFIRGGGNVELYERVSAALAQRYRQLGVESIVDIGCGDGRALVPALAAAGVSPALTLVEPSEALLSAALDALAGQARVTAHAVDAAAFTADLTERFDLAESTFALHAIPPAERST